MPLFVFAKRHRLDQSQTGESHATRCHWQLSGRQHGRSKIVGLEANHGKFDQEFAEGRGSGIKKGTVQVPGILVL